MFILIRRALTVASVLAVGAIAIPSAALAQAPPQTGVVPNKPMPSTIHRAPDHWGGASNGQEGSWSDAACEQVADTANILTEQSNNASDPLQKFNYIETARVLIEGASDNGCIFIEE